MRMNGADAKNCVQQYIVGPYAPLSISWRIRRRSLAKAGTDATTAKSAHLCVGFEWKGGAAIGLLVVHKGGGKHSVHYGTE